MLDDVKAIRRHLRTLEKQAQLVERFRAYAKTQGGRLTEFGRSFVDAARESGVKQAFVARLLDISAGAVSQHYNR